jgi:hypothetical protein
MEGTFVANIVQSVIFSRTERSSLSTPSHQVSGSGQSRNARQSRRRQTYVPDRGGQEYDYHFHETPLGLVESYFAESEQHHCTFAARNNPGRLLSESPEPSEPDSSDDDDVTALYQDDVVASVVEKEKKGVTFEKISHCGPRINITSGSHQDKIEIEVNHGRRAHNPCSSSDDNTEKYIEESATSDIDRKKAPYIPDDDLLKDRWYVDPWDRPPGQMWTKEIQDYNNLKAAIRGRGFKRERAAWLLNQLWKRKGTRFPFNERRSVKKPGQTAGEYFAALKKRRQEERFCGNQVKEYDEENALEECKWALELYNMVYGEDWPDNAVKAKASIPNVFADVDGDFVEEGSVPMRRKTRQHTSTPEPTAEKKVQTVDRGITLPPLGQGASPQEVERRNKDFRTHKARVLEEARTEREAGDRKEFMQFANRTRFSKAYIERPYSMSEE